MVGVLGDGRNGRKWRKVGLSGFLGSFRGFGWMGVGQRGPGLAGHQECSGTVRARFKLGCVRTPKFE